MHESYMAVSPHTEDLSKLLDWLVAHVRKPHDRSKDVKRLSTSVVPIQTTAT